MPTWIQNWDEQLLRWIAQWLRVPMLDPLMCVYTHLGDGGMLFIALAAVMLCWKKTRRAGGTALTAMALGAAITNLTIKPLLSRDRPWVVMDRFETLARSSDPNSFPSGHTCAAFAFAVAVAVSLPRRWAGIAAVAAAVLMGFSRLYVGVHFPSDVVAGAVIGGLCGLLAGRVAPMVLERYRARRADPSHKSSM